MSKTTNSTGPSQTASRRAVWFVSLLAGLVVTTPSPVLATQSVTLAWNPVATTNVAGYKVYYGSVSGNYTNVTSVGNVTNATISGLTDGATYYFATTTVGTSGMESGYSSEISYTVPVVLPSIQVTPGNIGYGTVLVGTSATNGFTVKNNGLGTLSGTASVGLPFSVVSGSSYNLAAGQTQLVMVVFSPVAAGNYNQSVNFSGGGGTNVMVSGSVTNALSLPVSMVINEKISASIINPITLQYCTNLSSPNWWTMGTFAGSTNCSFTNVPAVFIRGICSNLTGSITLTWPPSSNTGTAGYKVFYGTLSGVYTYVINAGKATTVTIPNLVAGKPYFFLVDTYNILGITSLYLNEIMATPAIPAFSLSMSH